MKKRGMLKMLSAVMILCTSVALAEGAGLVKGNPKSKVYHTATCYHYKAKGSTAEFKSEEAAKQAGYKPCRQCAKPDTKK